MMPKSPKRLTVALTFLTAAFFLPACNVQPSSPCSWVQPIYLETETVYWLNERLTEWPDSLDRDLNKIHKHNEKVKEICPPASPPQR